MRQEAALPRRILDALPYPIFWKGRDLRYLGCDAAFARLTGLEHPDAEDRASRCPCPVVEGASGGWGG